MSLLDTIRMGQGFNPPYGMPGQSGGLAQLVTAPNQPDPLQLEGLRKSAQMNLQTDAPKPQGGGGFLGSGYNGEDIMAMLVRAAALAQGDYGGALHAGQFIGKDKRDAAMRQTELADYEAKKQIDARYQDGPEPTTMYRQYKEAGYSEDQIRNLMQQDLESGRTKYVPLTDGGSLAGIQPGQPPRMVIAPNPGDQPLGASAGGVQEGATATNLQTGQKIQYRGGQWVPMGGGVGNGPGNFRP